MNVPSQPDAGDEPAAVAVVSLRLTTSVAAVVETVARNAGERLLFAAATVLRCCVADVG